MNGCFSAMLVLNETSFGPWLQSNYMEGWFVRASNHKQNSICLERMILGISSIDICIEHYLC